MIVLWIYIGMVITWVFVAMYKQATVHPTSPWWKYVLTFLFNAIGFPLAVFFALRYKEL